MQRRLIQTHFFPAQEEDRYVFFLDKGSSGAWTQKPFPSTLADSLTFLSLTNQAGGQFKLTGGAVAKVNVYEEMEGGNVVRHYHDVEILNSHRLIGSDLKESEVRQEYSKHVNVEQETLNPELEGMCYNTCDGLYISRPDCPNILTHELQCDTGECSEGGGEK